MERAWSHKVRIWGAVIAESSREWVGRSWRTGSLMSWAGKKDDNLVAIAVDDNYCNLVLYMPICQILRLANHSPDVMDSGNL